MTEIRTFTVHDEICKRPKFETKVMQFKKEKKYKAGSIKSIIAHIVVEPRSRKSIIEICIVRCCHYYYLNKYLKKKQ